MSGGLPAVGCRRSVRNWPGKAAGSATPSGATSSTDSTLSLSLAMRVTTSERNPCHAGGGLPAAAVSPGLPAARLRVVRLLEERAQRRLPSRTQGRNPQRPYEIVPRTARQIEQRIDLGDAHPLRPRRDLRDLLPRLDFSFREHAHVEAGPPVGHQQRGHPRLVQTHAHPVAGHPWLRDLEHRVADAIAIADADLVVRQAPRR